MTLKNIYVLAIFAIVISSCEKTVPPPKFSLIPVRYGPEDILIDNSTGEDRILASCSARRQQYGSSGDIVSVNIQDNTFHIMERQGEPEGFILHPHGFDIVTISSTTYLYVITHKSYNDTGNFIVRYIVNNKLLTFDKLYSSPFIVSPNAIALLPDGGFYFSNDGNEDLLNIFLKPTNGSLIYSDVDGNMSIAEDGLRYPNGVAIKGSKLFLATVLGNALYSYDINNDRTLSSKKILCSGYGWDNFRWNGKMLIAARHSDIPKFLSHYVDAKSYSPSEIAAIDTATGLQDIILKNDGSIISGVSTALIHNDKIYCGQIFEPYIVAFDDDYAY